MLAPAAAVNEGRPIGLVGSFDSYPNPVRGRATVSYEIDRLVPVLLTVTDASGRRIATLVDARQSPGRHSVEWGASNVAPGVYFVALQSGGRTLTRQLVVNH